MQPGLIQPSINTEALHEQGVLRKFSPNCLVLLSRPRNHRSSFAPVYPARFEGEVIVIIYHFGQTILFEIMDDRQRLDKTNGVPDLRVFSEIFQVGAAVLQRMISTCDPPGCEPLGGQPPTLGCVERALQERCGSATGGAGQTACWLAVHRRS